MSTTETKRSWTHCRVERRNPRYCHVTFDHPPINTITATTVAELGDLVGLIEQDPDLRVVVFDSANPDFYLGHYDLENDPSRTEALGGGPMARLSRLVGRGRALEILLVADDLDGPRAEQYGYVNRLIADDQLDAEESLPDA